MVLKACEHCGVQFDAESSNAKAKRQGKLKRFCSRRCRNLSRPTLPGKPVDYFNQICGRCGQQFDATPSRPKYAKPRKYCRGCVREGRKATFAKRNAHLSETKICEVCGREFAVPIRAMRSGKYSGKFCSVKCCYESRRGVAKPFGQARKIGAARTNPKGYVEIKVAPKQWMLEHRYVMGQIMGRALHQWENVHHIDGNRSNNDPSNLELWIKTQPSGVRLADVAEVYGAELVSARLRIRELEAQLSHHPL